MRNDKATKDFLDSMGRFYHLRMLEYLKRYATAEEIAQIKEDDVLTINYDENPNVNGSYSIPFKLLKSRAKKEEKQFLKEKNLNTDKSNLN